MSEDTMFWCDKPLDSLSREELIEAIKYLYRIQQEDRQIHGELIETFSMDQEKP